MSGKSTAESYQDQTNLSQNAYITEATVRHTFETLRKLYPVDIYLETSVSNWSGTLSQPSGTVTERTEVAKANPKLFVNREFSIGSQLPFEIVCLPQRPSGY
jgi:hypothetical protein